MGRRGAPMPDLLRVTRVRFTHPPAEVRSPNLIGYVSFGLPGLGRLDGISVRKLGDRCSLVFPSRKDRGGRRHAYFVPSNREVLRTIEAQVLGELHRRGIIQ